MKIKPLTLSLLLFTPAMLALQPRGTKLAFAVEEGLVSKKTFTSEVQMVLDDFSMLMNGQESPMTPDMSMENTVEFELVVSDEYVEMGDGAPAKLLRTFETLESNRSSAMEVDMMGQVQSSDSSAGAESELEGATVQFKWDEDTGEFTVSFPDDDGDEELLEGLLEDLDLRMFLPEEEVAEGDEWKVDPLALQTILAPGGDLKLVPEESDGDDEMMMGMNSDAGNTGDWFNEDLEGEVTATLEGMREADDGTQVAVIAIRFEISNAVDVTEEARKEMEEAELPPEVTSMDLQSADIEMELEGEGTLLWNVAKGCAYSCEVEADLTLIVDAAVDIAAGGMEMEIEQGMEFSGTMNATAQFGAEE